MHGCGSGPSGATRSVSLTAPAILVMSSASSSDRTLSTRLTPQPFWRYISRNPTGLFRLRRYNGKSHEHTNSIEGDTFYDWHIHMATERYQGIGAREDAYAEVTDRYNNLDEALSCLFDDAGFDVPPKTQLSFFE